MTSKSPPDLFDELAADSVIDDTNLDKELTRIPYIQAKWMKTYTTLNRQLRRAENTQAILRLEKTNYFLGLAPDEVYKENPLNRVLLKTDVPAHLAADEEWMEAVEEVEVLREVAVLVEKFISSLNNRGYNLGKAVDYVRWKNGG